MERDPEIEARYRWLASRRWSLGRVRPVADSDDWKRLLRVDELIRLVEALRWTGGYVADLPHPYQSSTGSVHCEVCDGHFDRLIHLPPWQKPQYAPCSDCIGDPDTMDCLTCGGTRMTFQRIGVTEVSPAPAAKPQWRRRWLPGSKWKRRKFKHHKPYKRKEKHDS